MAGTEEVLAESGDRTRSAALPDWVAAVVTFLASGAVLVLEIAGLRLIAPYVGITLQTNTAVIGFALAAIAVGAWMGGALADRTDPRRLIAPLLVAGGALVVAVLPLVLPRDRWADWLDRAGEDVAELAAPTPPELVEGLELRPVSPAVNSVKNNGVGLTARVESVAPPADQPALF